MNHFFKKANNFIIVFFCMVPFITFSQLDLNISGQVSNVDGSPAVETGLLLTLYDYPIDEFTTTDENGNYQFNILTPNNEDCFTLWLINCDGSFLFYDECYSPTNTSFQKDFIFCENGAETCSTFITTIAADSSETLILSTLNFGIGPFTYLWSDGTTESSIEIPIDYSGEYCVTITDSQGCVAFDCIYLEPLDPCFVFISEEIGYQSTGLYANGYGQSENIDYLWSTTEVTSEIQVTETGEYCVTITDAFGCTSSDCVFIEIDTTEWLDCFAYITEIASGEGLPSQLFAQGSGNAPFLYNWSFEGNYIGNTEVITPEVAGEYCVTVIDIDSCTYTTCYQYLDYTPCSVYIECPAENFGQLTAVATGISPINYMWNTGEQGAQITVEVSGEYCVSIVDGAGCQSEYCHIIELDSIDNCGGDIIIEYIDDTTAVLSVQFANGQNPENAAYYWFTTDEESPTIEVSDLGVYCVFVILDNGCAFEACTYFTGNMEGFNNGLMITYFDPFLEEGQSAEIELYKFNGDNLDQYGILQNVPLPNLDGLYYINDLEDGTYIARAKPQDSENYIPSYMVDSPYWDESEQFIIQNGGSGFGDIKAIHSLCIYELKGPGQIEGISYGLGTSDNIMLFHDFDAVGQEYTDLNGGFSFNSLPYGTYTVVRERPGFPRDIIIVTITPDNPIVNISFEENTSNVDNNNMLESEVFPNPTSSYVNISSPWFDHAKPVVSVLDINGKEVRREENITNTEEVLKMDLSNISQGIYFIKIQLGNRIETHKIIKI